MRFLHFLSKQGFILLLLVFSFLSTIQASEELGVYEKLDQFIKDDIILVDENFNEVNIKNAIDKPTIIAMVYYECPGICTPLLNGLADVMRKSDLELGKDYQVFTISFAHSETPVLAQRKKKTYAKIVGKGDLENGWHFFTGDSLTIDRFLDNIGYKVKQEGEEFIHPATLVVVSPGGKITRYLHGTNYLPFDVKMAVVEAGLERSGPTITKILDFCFSYDAEGKKYVFNVTKVSGSIIMIMALALLVTLVISNRKKKIKNTQ